MVERAELSAGLEAALTTERGLIADALDVLALANQSAIELELHVLERERLELTFKQRILEQELARRGAQAKP